MLYDLEVNYGWLTELCRLATDRVDYLSISINAGTNDSFRKVTGARGNELDNALNGIALGLKIREETNAKGPSIRLCYLMSGANATQKDIDAICEFAIEFKVDSLRFSIPFANYNQSFEKVHKYRDNVEQKNKDAYYNMVQKYLSTDESAKPYIFWNGPHFTDVDLYTFDRCAYGYYQITYGADGYVYKCSTVATPTAKQCRIGKVTSDLGEFKNMVVRNYDQKWSCKRGCFDNGVRCNRMGIEINSMIGGNL
jgi:MoaA/NifB/PqqE/SkfB family radical SAM enzyme